MKHFTVSCFVSLILATNAWQDYTDYYDYDDDYLDDNDIKTLEVRLGSKVNLTCNHNPLDTVWLHNGNHYYPFVTEPPITDWFGGGSGMEIMISSKTDTGIWGCQSSGSKVKVYNLTLNSEGDQHTELAQSLEKYRYPSEVPSTSTKSPLNTLIFNTALHHTSSERSTYIIPVPSPTTTNTPSSSSTVYSTQQSTHDVTVVQRSTTRQSVTTSKSLENEPETLAFLIEKELSYSFDNPFFNFKSKTTAKSSSIQASVSPVLLLLFVIEMLVCLLRI